MAFQLDTRIPLLARGVDTGGALQQGVQTAGMIDQLRTAREEAPIRQQLLQQQLKSSELSNQRQQQALQLADENRVITSIAQGAQEILPSIDSGDFKGAADKLKTRRARLVSEGVTDLSDTDLAIQALESGDAQQIQRIKTDANTAINIAQTRGLLGASGGKLSAEQRGFENLIKNFSEEDQIKARKVRAGIVARAGESAQERIAADEAKKNQVARLEEQLAESKAVGKGKGEAKVAPLVSKAKSDISAAVKLATTEATARGEALTDLNRANAALPGLRSVVDQLKDLAPIATSTLGGRIFDTAVKESGFGSTKGATAKAKFVAIVNNQVLPLLKPTFGGAFTTQEGDALKATLGDPDASPEEKIAQLDAFIESKVQQIETKERELAGPQGAQQNSFTSSSGITFTVE